MAAPAIAVEGLRKRYGDLQAVDGLSFRVEAGEVFGLLGPNGAGKTTAIESIIGLRRPDAGSIAVLGLDWAAHSPAIKARLGVGLQSTGLFPKLTVRETLDLHASFFPKTVPVDRLIATVGLESKQRARVATLSGGQRQRLSLALALVGDPDLIFLDEPTAAMDPQARRGVWDVVSELSRRGKTVLLTTHYMEEAAQLCHRVAVMDRGRIIAAGPPDALVRQYFAETAIEFAAQDGLELAELQRLPGAGRVQSENGVITVFSRDVPETVSGLMHVVRERGLALDGFTVRTPTLEDVFLHLTGRRMRN